MNEPTTTVESRPYDVRFDAGRYPRAKLGFVVLAMEQTVEEDAFRLAPPGVGVHFSRLAMSNDATIESLEGMEPGIAEAAALLRPEDDLDVVSYTCNCGTMVIGEERVMAALAAGRPGAKTTTVMTGVVRSLRALGAKRIAVATPYSDEINARVMGFLQGHGFEVVAFQGLNLKTNIEIDLVAPEYLFEFGKSVDRADAEALFFCCGALRTLDIVGRLEAAVAKPVVVSNQAMMWDALRLAGIDDKLEGYGRLFELGSEARERAA